MPGLFDLLQSAMGRPNPQQQIAAALNQMPGQVGGPPSPTGASTALPGGAGAAGTPGGQGAPGGAPGPPQQPPQPQVYQSPPDLGSMYLQLAQRSQAEQSFNNGIAGLVASVYPGRTSGALMSSLRGNVQDPSEVFGNLVKLQMFNQQQQLFGQQIARYNDLVSNSDKYAKSFGVDPDMFKATITAAGPQGAGDVLGKIAEAQMGLTGSQLDKEYKQTVRQWGTTPESQDAQGNPLPRPAWLNTEAGFQAHQLTVEGQAKDVREAAQALPQYNASLGDMSNRIDKIQGEGDVINGILSSTAKQAAAQTILNAEPGSLSGIIAQSAGVLSDKEMQAIGDLRQLKMQNYASNFKSGQRLTQQEASRLGQAADQITNLAVSPGTYMSNLTDVKTKLGHAQANAYGAAEDFDNLPMNLRPLMDPSYLKGGVNARDITPMPQWAQPVTVSDPKDLAKLPKGQAYRILAGPYAGVHYVGFKDDGTPTQ